MYVIVVDDQKPVGDQLVDRLVRQGYPARHFTDAQFFSPGSETASIGFGDTTAVLADFHMGVSGLDVLAEASARNPRMPLALCTATLPAARLLELNADPRCQQAGLAVGKKGPHLGNLLLMAQEALLDPAFRPEDRTQLLRELAKDYPPTLSASQETAHLVCGLVRTYVNTMQSVLSSLRSDFRLEDWPTWQRVGAGLEARVSSLAQMCQSALDLVSLDKKVFGQFLHDLGNLLYTTDLSDIRPPKERVLSAEALAAAQSLIKTVSTELSGICCEIGSIMSAQLKSKDGFLLERLLFAKFGFRWDDGDMIGEHSEMYPDSNCSFANDPEDLLRNALIMLASLTHSSLRLSFYSTSLNQIPDATKMQKLAEFGFVKGSRLVFSIERRQLDVRASAVLTRIVETGLAFVDLSAKQLEIYIPMHQPDSNDTAKLSERRKVLKATKVAELDLTNNYGVSRNIFFGEYLLTLEGKSCKVVAIGCNLFTNWDSSTKLLIARHQDTFILADNGDGVFGHNDSSRVLGRYLCQVGISSEEAFEIVRRSLRLGLDEDGLKIEDHGRGLDGNVLGLEGKESILSMLRALGAKTPHFSKDFCGRGWLVPDMFE